MTDKNDKHTGLERVVDKAADTVGGFAGRLKANTAGSVSGAEFAKNAAIGDLYEIQAARLALRRARAPETKATAQKMIDDHTTSTHHLRSAMRMNATKGLAPLPLEMDERRKGMIEHLEAAPDDKFDETYLDQQIAAHKETVALMTGFRDSGDNAQLRSLATGTAPVVERHLAHVEALRKQMG